MAAAAIIAVRKKLNMFGGTPSSSEKQDLLGRLPPSENRELDTELGMLIAG
jgi:hypothetical protein